MSTNSTQLNYISIITLAASLASRACGLLRTPASARDSFSRQRSNLMATAASPTSAFSQIPANDNKDSRLFAKSDTKVSQSLLAASQAADTSLVFLASARDNTSVQRSRSKSTSYWCFWKENIHCIDCLFGIDSTNTANIFNTESDRENTFQGRFYTFVASLD